MEVPDTLESAYTAYQADPSQGNLHTVVTKLRPTIDYQLSSLGVSNDPVMRTKATVYAAKAIPKFDPSVSSLPTFVSSQLKQLTRDRRLMSTPLKIPERAQLDAFHLHRKEQEYIDKYGKEPDAQELSDHVGIPIDRISKIRDTMMAVPSETAMGEATTHTGPDFLMEATKYVHADADYVDRRILELKTGYGMGKSFKHLRANEIAQKLNISPSQVSRRIVRLTNKIEEIREALEVS